MAQLTPGSILRAYNNDTDQKPVVQVIDIKPIGSGTGTRYRLVISDGNHYVPAMLATQVSVLIDQGVIGLWHIVRLNEFICNIVNERKILIILNVEMIDRGPGHKIGNPASVGGGSGSVKVEGTGASMGSSSTAGHTSFKAGGASMGQSSSFYGGGGLGGSQSSGSGARSFHPIATLNPYQNRWVIKARVTKKGDMRTWQNQRSGGEGKLFSVDLLDAEGGQIRATMFNDAADKFFPILQQDKVYILSKGNLKLANKRFNTLPNEYEITFNADAEVQYVDDDRSIDQQKFDFKNIASIKNIDEGSFCDVIGVVIKVGPIATLISKRTSKELVKRVLTLADDTLQSIDLTLWGDNAEKYNEAELKDNPVVACKSAGVSDFGGKTLSCSFNSQLFVNLDRPEAHRLRAWYDEKGKGASFDSMSNSVGGGSRNDPRKFLSDIKEEGLGGDKAVYFLCRATVTFFRHDVSKPPWYNACPSKDGCNKKVLPDETNTQWNCEKCNKTYDHCIPRYILSMLVCDQSGSSWLTAFNDQAEMMLGKSAREMDDFVKAGAEPAFEAVFKEANFKTYLFKIRSKLETNQDQQQVKSHIMSATPVDFRKESEYLLSEIAKYD
eukprot:g74900.t1